MICVSLKPLCKLTQTTRDYNVSRGEVCAYDRGSGSIRDRKNRESCLQRRAGRKTSADEDDQNVGLFLTSMLPSTVRSFLASLHV